MLFLWYYIFIMNIFFKFILIISLILTFYNLYKINIREELNKFKIFYNTNDFQSCIQTNIDLSTLTFSLIIFIKDQKFKSLKFFIYLFIFY